MYCYIIQGSKKVLRQKLIRVQSTSEQKNKLTEETITMARRKASNKGYKKNTTTDKSYGKNTKKNASIDLVMVLETEESDTAVNNKQSHNDVVSQDIDRRMVIVIDDSDTSETVKTTKRDETEVTLEKVCRNLYRAISTKKQTEYREFDVEQFVREILKASSSQFWLENFFPGYHEYKYTGKISAVYFRGQTLSSSVFKAKTKDPSPTVDQISTVSKRTKTYTTVQQLAMHLTLEELTDESITSPWKHFVYIIVQRIRGNLVVYVGKCSSAEYATRQLGYFSVAYSATNQKPKLMIVAALLKKQEKEHGTEFLPIIVIAKLCLNSEDAKQYERKLIVENAVASIRGAWIATNTLAESGKDSAKDLGYKLEDFLKYQEEGRQLKQVKTIRQSVAEASDDEMEESSHSLCNYE